MEDYSFIIVYSFYIMDYDYDFYITDYDYESKSLKILKWWAITG